MGILGTGGGSSYPTALDTHEQQTDGAAGTLADAGWANDIGSAILAIQTELGTNPAGTLADVVTRLLTVIAAGGGLRNGTTANRPGSPTTGQPYWNTTLGQLEIYNGTDWTAIAGVSDHGGLTGLTDDDHTQYLLANGTRSSTGDVVVEKSTPAFELKGTESSAGRVRFYESAGTLYIQEYSGAAWNTRVQITLATGEITLSAEDVNGYDSTNAAAVSLVTHSSRHRQSGYDALNYFQATFTSAIATVNAAGYDLIGTIPTQTTSGSKTFNLKANAYQGNAAQTGDVKFDLLNSSGASALVSTSLTATGTILTASFVATASGEGLLRLWAKTSDVNYPFNVKSIYIWTT